jgi:hypothetical protein
MLLKQLELLLEMKNNFLKIILGCFIASFFFACESNESNVLKEDAVCAEPVVSAINPNGDSELALLMRQMYYDADTIKQRILNDNGNITDEFIAKLQQVHTANPTDPTIKTQEFEAFNNFLISTTKSVQEDSNNQMAGFNTLVARCIDCHQSFCPGPIKRIKKLKIVME